MNNFPTGESPLIKLEHINFSYGKIPALIDFSLEIAPRKLVGLIGPDGVGKSTMLSLITGVRAVQDGNVTVLGGNMRDKSHRDKICPKIAYMPQGLGKNLYFTLTVEENLQFFGKLFDHNAAERRRRIDHLTRSTGLYNFLNRPAGKLSGGMKQKLGLCCALIHDPDLLVLDEPTTGVDPLARRQFWDLVDSVREIQTQMTVIVATAYMDEAQRFEWLIAMDGGRILDTGTPAEIFEKTGCDNLDDAFIQLLPENLRAGHKKLIVPPLAEEEKPAIAISANGLTKKFGAFTAVDHVSFKIRQGEIFGFLGSNGCGKTTTMRMLTGLMTPTEGKAELFGKTIEAESMETRLHLGYMTQLFSLYNELTVRQNLMLYARLYRIGETEINARVDEMLQRFQLNSYEHVTPQSLPLGIKQRLSLAAAVIHRPQILILDEPTSGVDPVARDLFWELIIELSRRDKVTIFITTHFMNEAERCDRISLMHAGKSLACDTPENLIAERKTSTLEAAFIDYLEEADPASREKVIIEKSDNAATGENSEKQLKRKFFSSGNSFFSIQRLLCCCWREYLELMRDPIRATLAIFGALLLMFVMSFGISMDVEDLKFAVFDRDGSELSNDYTLNISGSRYFIEQPEIEDYDDLEARMRSGELSLVVEIPPDFGRDMEAGRSPEVAFWIDGSMPSRAETIDGYVSSMHNQWLEKRATESGNNGSAASLSADVETRYRYNPDVKSLPAMVPAVIPLLLLMIPAVLAALAVVREKETGSIINLYATPLSRLEFMLGKQMPYVLFSIFSSLILVTMAVSIFDVPVKGSVAVLILSLILYSLCSTGIGLLASSVTRSQIAVIFMTMLGTMLPAVQFCGMIDPVNSQEGAGRLIGTLYPASYMLLISRGVFNKALGFADLPTELLALLITVPVVIGGGVMFLKKQEK